MGDMRAVLNLIHASLEELARKVSTIERCLTVVESNLVSLRHDIQESAEKTDAQITVVRRQVERFRAEPHSRAWAPTRRE